MRIATRTATDTLAATMQANLSSMNGLHQQLATGKRAQTYAGLTEVAGLVTARAVAGREEAYAAAAGRADGRMTTYDMQIGALYDAGESVRQALLRVRGTGDMAGLKAAVESLFNQARATLNARDGEGPIFATPDGKEQPFEPTSLAALGALPSPDLFAPGAARATVRMGDDAPVAIGLTAEETGAGVARALHRLAQMPLDAQTAGPAMMSDVEAAITDVAAALEGLGLVRAGNGRRQEAVERLRDTAETRVTLLTRDVSRVEDADLADVSTQLMATQSALQASYALFARLREASLVNYLR